MSKRFPSSSPKEREVWIPEGPAIYAFSSSEKVPCMSTRKFVWTGLNRLTACFPALLMKSIADWDGRFDRIPKLCLSVSIRSPEEI